jgi:hypothetical protein
MPQLHIRAKLVTKAADIKQSILDDFAKTLKLKLNSGILVKVEKVLQKLIKIKLEKSPEAASLRDGELLLHFGLTDSNVKVDDIIEKLSTKAKATLTPITSTGGRIKGGLRISLDLQSAQNELLALSSAIQITKKGEKLPWLEWLLKRGKEIIIEHYFYAEGNYKRSRTGRALMFKGEGKRWFVPHEFSGTINDNWITRSLDSLDTDIPIILQEALKLVK